MTIKTVQKIIKIGTSRGVTIPAKDLKALGLDTGTKVKITVEPIEKPTAGSQILDEYAEFARQYRQTLENLRDR